MYIYGTDSDDNLRGFNEADNIFGGNGYDRISGGKGNDKLYGDGDGIHGNDGNDTIVGGGSWDNLWGGSGNDVFLYNNLSESIYTESPEESHISYSGAYHRESILEYVDYILTLKIV